MTTRLLLTIGLASGALACGSASDAGPDAAPPTPCTDDPCTADGCSPVLLYQVDPRTEGHLAVGDGHVCISFRLAEGGDPVTTEYVCFDRCGGPPLVEANSAGFPAGMALHGDELTAAVSVAFPDGYARVSRLSLATGTSTPLWSTEGDFHFRNLLRRGDSHYFSSDVGGAREGIFRMPYGGGAPLRISDWTVASILYGMVQLDDVLYFSSETPDHQGLHSMPIDGGTPTLLYRSDVFFMTSVAARAGRLFWAELGENTIGGLVKASAADGSDLRTLATLPDRVKEIAVDDDTVYVATYGATSGIRAVPVGGGDVTVPLAVESRVDRLTADADYLFFVGGLGLYRLRKHPP